MREAREAIIEDQFPAFTCRFFKTLYKEQSKYPQWAIDALKSVGIDLLEAVNG